MKVRELEERLIQARADLVEARLGARHVEAAECRTRHGRVPRPAGPRWAAGSPNGAGSRPLRPVCAARPHTCAGISLDCAGWTRCDRHMGIYAVIFRALGVSCHALVERDRNTGSMTPAEGTYRQDGVPSK